MVINLKNAALNNTFSEKYTGHSHQKLWRLRQMRMKWLLTAFRSQLYVMLTGEVRCSVLPCRRGDFDARRPTVGDTGWLLQRPDTLAQPAWSLATQNVKTGQDGACGQRPPPASMGCPFAAWRQLPSDCSVPPPQRLSFQASAPEMFTVSTYISDPFLEKDHNTFNLRQPATPRTPESRLCKRSLSMFK